MYTAYSYLYSFNKQLLNSGHKQPCSVDLSPHKRHKCLGVRKGPLSQILFCGLPQSFPIKILTTDKFPSCHFLHTRPLQKPKYQTECSKLCDFYGKKYFKRSRNSWD